MEFDVRILLPNDLELHWSIPMLLCCNLEHSDDGIPIRAPVLNTIFCDYWALN